MAPKLLNILLQRNDSNVQWGFRLSGGKDHAKPLTIVKVFSGTLAAQYLTPGDTVLTIQGYDSKELLYVEAVELVRDPGRSLELVILKTETPLYNKDDVQTLPRSIWSPEPVLQRPSNLMMRTPSPFTNPYFEPISPRPPTFHRSLSGGDDPKGLYSSSPTVLQRPSEWLNRSPSPFRPTAVYGEPGQPTSPTFQTPSSWMSQSSSPVSPTSSTFQSPSNWTSQTSSSASPISPTFQTPNTWMTQTTSPTSPTLPTFQTPRKWMTQTPPPTQYSYKKPTQVGDYEQSPGYHPTTKLIDSASSTQYRFKEASSYEYEEVPSQTSPVYPAQNTPVAQDSSPSNTYSEPKLTGYRPASILRKHFENVSHNMSQQEPRTGYIPTSLKFRIKGRFDDFESKTEFSISNNNLFVDMNKDVRHEDVYRPHDKKGDRANAENIYFQEHITSKEASESSNIYENITYFNASETKTYSKERENYHTENIQQANKDHESVFIGADAIFRQGNYLKSRQEETQGKYGKDRENEIRKQMDVQQELQHKVSGITEHLTDLSIQQQGYQKLEAQEDHIQQNIKPYKKVETTHQSTFSKTENTSVESSLNIESKTPSFGDIQKMPSTTDILKRPISPEFNVFPNTKGSSLLKIVLSKSLGNYSPADFEKMRAPVVQELDSDDSDDDDDSTTEGEVDEDEDTECESQNYEVSSTCYDSSLQDSGSVIFERYWMIENECQEENEEDEEMQYSTTSRNNSSNSVPSRPGTPATFQNAYAPLSRSSSTSSVNSRPGTPNTFASLNGSRSNTPRPGTPTRSPSPCLSWNSSLTSVSPRPGTPRPFIPSQPGTPTTSQPSRSQTPMTSRPGTPTNAVPSRPGTPTNFVPSRPESPTNFVPSRPGTPTDFVPSRPGTPTNVVPSRPESPTNFVPSRPGTPTTFIPVRPLTPTNSSVISSSEVLSGPQYNAPLSRNSSTSSVSSRPENLSNLQNGLPSYTPLSRNSSTSSMSSRPGSPSVGQNGTPSYAPLSRNSSTTSMPSRPGTPGVGDNSTGELPAPFPMSPITW